MFFQEWSTWHLMLGMFIRASAAIIILKPIFGASSCCFEYEVRFTSGSSLV
jgi:hypothetical protein